MAQTPDAVALYGRSLGWQVRYRTVLVEGTTDAELFHLAAQLELEEIGIDLLGEELAVIAAGEGQLGGTHGVVRELICLRGYSRTCLGRNGRPLYRFLGLFDNDKTGRNAIGNARRIDTSILEYRDVFRIHPIMPIGGTAEPRALGKAFEQGNLDFKGLDWEVEDLLLANFVEAFLTDYPDAVGRTTSLGGRVHRDFTRDGKARLHRYVKLNAIRADLAEVVGVLKALRFYLGLHGPPAPTATILQFPSR